MKPTANCRTSLMAVSLSSTVLFLASSTAFADLYEDFDGGGTMPWSFVNSSGTAPSLQVGGPSGTYARITNLTASNNNSLAFDEDPSVTGPAPYGLRLQFNFRLSDDAASMAAGGCCGSAADGLGIGLFAVSYWGSTGPVNPGSWPSTGGEAWERPHFRDAFAVGIDIFQNLDDVNLNWNGVEIANASLHGIFDLNNSLWHRMMVDLFPDGANTRVDVSIIGDVFGATSVQPVFAGQLIAGMDLANLPEYRLIAGGRTGGAFANGDLDNISLTRAVPEPSAMAPMALLSLGAGLFLVRRRTVS